MRDLVPFVQSKKLEKHPLRSVNFSKVATLIKLALLDVCFSRFLNCTNGTKSRNASHMLILYFHIFQRGFEVLEAIFQASVYVTIATAIVYYNVCHC